MEAEFQQDVAVRRRPILLLVFCFDVTCYLFRMVVKYVKTDVTLVALVKGMFPQLCNMVFLYTFLGLLNRRSRRLGDSAARQVVIHSKVDHGHVVRSQNAPVALAHDVMLAMLTT